MSLNYTHLSDEELIHYASIDAPTGSLAQILVTRFKVNFENIKELEYAHHAAEEKLQAEYDEATEARDDEHAKNIDILDAQISDLQDEVQSLSEDVTDRDLLL